MKHRRVGLAALVTLALPAAVAVAQPDVDESDPAPGDLAPDGETVVESDEVIGPDDGPPPPDDEPIEEVGGKPVAGYDKGFFLRSQDQRFSVKISGRVQPQLVMVRTKDPAADWQGRFQIRRARLTFEGNLHGKDLLYKFQTDFGRGFATLKDFYVDARVSGDAWVRAGQWKRPFSRQQIASSGRLELVDRAITDRVFGAGRDIGIALRNDYEKSPEIEWIVGVWNGTGEEPLFRPDLNDLGELEGGSFTNVPREFLPAFVGRIGVNSGGIKGYSEADLEGGPLRWGAAASFWLEGDFDRDDASNDKVQLDYIVKANGFSSTGGFYAMTQQTDTQVLSSQELALIGFHVQAGYMLSKEWQVAARYASILDQAEDPVDQAEVAIGANFYGWGHDAKVAADVRMLQTGESELLDNVAIELGANVAF